MTTVRLIGAIMPADAGMNWPPVETTRSVVASRRHYAPRSEYERLVIDVTPNDPASRPTRDELRRNLRAMADFYAARLVALEKMPDDNFDPETVIRFKLRGEPALVYAAIKIVNASGDVRWYVTGQVPTRGARRPWLTWDELVAWIADHCVSFDVMRLDRTVI